MHSNEITESCRGTRLPYTQSGLKLRSQTDRGFEQPIFPFFGLKIVYREKREAINEHKTHKEHVHRNTSSDPLAFTWQRSTQQLI